MDHSKEKLQVVRELHKPLRKKFKRRRTIVKGLHDLWQSDLAQMDLFARENNGYSYILVVIDCFSKFVWAKPLKNKTGLEVTQAFSYILKHSKTTPKNLQTDQGKEFFNRDFQNLLKSKNINHYNSYSKMKAAIVERVIRTLKEKLFRYFSLNGTYKWIDILARVVSEYNSSFHRTIGLKPCEVTKAKEKFLLKSKYNFIKIAGANKHKVGDIVRISREKHVFEKSYTPNWSTELFKIVEVKITNPVTYLLEDYQGHPIKGAFYEQELQKTLQPDVYLVEKVLKKKKNQIFVKYLGFDDSHNSWINKNDIL